MSKLLIASAVLLGGLWLGGCATQDYVDKQVGGVQGQVTGLHGEMQNHFAAEDNRIDGVDRMAREALDRARAAGQLAQGKFVYAVLLSDDATKFPVNGWALSDTAKARLSDFANRLKQDNKPVYVEIQGYTDATGTPGANYRLGADRAESVRRFLNEQGVALNRMSTISYGQDDAIASNGTRAGRAQNRRVALIVLD